MDTRVTIDHLGSATGRGAVAAIPFDDDAGALGVGCTTARRGPRGGGLPGASAAGPHGPTRSVNRLEPAAPPRESVPPQPAPPAAAQAAALVAAQEAVRYLGAHVDDLRRQLEARTREAAQLHALLAQTHHWALPSGEEAPRAQPPEGRAGRGWWRRLWGARRRASRSGPRPPRRERLLSRTPARPRA
jgi:hypothetical protein